MGRKIFPKTELKYLGVILGRNLTFVPYRKDRIQPGGPAKYYPI